MSRPLVSVVIPVFNQGSYVQSALDSVLSQDYAPLEVVVIDDGSTDDTPDRLREYADRCITLRQDNRGAANALNRGIRASRGAYVCWLSADDVFLPGKIAAQVASFTATPEVGLVHTGFEVIDAEGRVHEQFPTTIVEDDDPLIAIFWRNPINGSTVMMRRDVFVEAGGFDESLRADVDVDMWLRVARRHRIAFVEGCFGQYRVHQNTLSANQRLMTLSISMVRSRRLRSGELRRRLADRADGPTVLARISTFFARSGWIDLAAETLREADSAGLPSARLWVSAGAIQAWGFLARHPRIRRAGRTMLSFRRRLSNHGVSAP